MKKKLIVKPPEPKPVCCKTCLVRAACSIEMWSECPDAWSEIMKKGSCVYWPMSAEHSKEILIEEGYSDEDAEIISQVPELLQGINRGKLTIRPATRFDRNVIKFVVTEY